MGFVQTSPAIEQWLEAHSEAWRCITDAEYASVVSRWKENFWRLIELSYQTRTGTRAIADLGHRFPASVFLFSGVRVPLLANMGGPGTCGYHATLLRKLDREVANTEELILVSDRFAFSYVFSHEAGAMVWEHLYVARGAV